MSLHEDQSLVELEAQMNQLHAESDAGLARCDKLVNKIDARHKQDKARFEKAHKLLAETKVAAVAPHILAAAQRLPHVELKLKVAEFEINRNKQECKRLQVKHMNAFQAELRFKKENKQLTKTIESLTAGRETDTTSERNDTQSEKEQLKEQLAALTAQMKVKTDECASKDAFIANQEREVAELRVEFAAYQDFTSNSSIHRHDGCNEHIAALEEQHVVLTTHYDDKINTLQSKLTCATETYKTKLEEQHVALTTHYADKINTVTTECGVLQSKLNDATKVQKDKLEEQHDDLTALYEDKMNALTVECDILQNELNNATKTQKSHIEEDDNSACEGSSDCQSCVLHLERSLRIARTAETQALQLVDQVNYDCMIAWNQLHEYQTRVMKQTRIMQERYASVGSWIAAQRTPSMSSAESDNVEINL